MSSPTDSITDLDEASLNKKRGRATSVEPTADQHAPIQDKSTTEAITSIAPKKTKREDEDSTATVGSIRRNMKDMSTTDRVSEEAEESSSSPEQPSLLAQFGGSKSGHADDDWGEFADEDEDEDDVNQKTTKEPVAEEKPKYTFGASSGFGTKGWAATHQTIPKSTFGSFGDFKSSPMASNTNLTVSTEHKQVPSFSSFAKATSSPFAAAAAAAVSNTKGNDTPINAFSGNSTETNSSASSPNTVGLSKERQEESDTSFGGSVKVKVPGVKQTEVKTGEEEEDTIFQTKAKLLVLDTATSNWKERGVGTFRINQNEETNQARLVMRTDSVYRLILNLKLFKGMKVFIMQDKFVRFAGFEAEVKEDNTSETKLINFALKLGSPSVAQDVCERIIKCIPSDEEEEKEAN
ncbi:Ran-specific GTPase-activating protein 2 [Choanephora cucurbitarum]|uniref:Ran-specific GTPase-activating protein 2 n=1 Tax=Choanephora cucurbitarum TaxID=101091 RepID=A0A1C7N4D3_9FUNG|nr:Ran-specific GTPase-activating protein 2 [Choanephora cucurbitarum]